MTATVKKQPTCKNNDGEIEVTSPLGTQYEYKLSTNSSYQVSPTFKNLKAGTYSVEVINKTDGSKGSVMVELTDNSTSDSYYIKYKDKKYKNDEVIPVAVSDNAIVLQFFDGNGAKANITWSGATMDASDNSKASFVRKKVSSNVNGTTVNVTEKECNNTFSVKVVVIQFNKFNLDLENDLTLDPNKKLSNVYEEAYASYNEDTDKLPIPWKLITASIKPTEILFEVTPSGAEKYVDFNFGNTGENDAPESYKSKVNNNKVSITATVAFKNASIKAKISDEIIEYSYLFLTALNEVCGLPLKIIVINEENDDVNDIEVGKGLKNTVCIKAGVNNVIDSKVSGDDQLVGNEINTGLDGIRQTQILGDDIEANGIKIGKGMPNAKGVSWGKNKFRDTSEKNNRCKDDDGTGKGCGDDKLMKDENGEEYFNTGADGICETPANNQPLENQSWNTLGINRAVIYAKINEFYKQANYEFCSMELETIDVNYDSNRDGKLEKKSGVRAGKEEELLFKNLGLEGNLTTPTIVIVDKFSDPNLNGVATGFGSNKILMNAFNGVDNKDFFLLTFPHELGHAVFSLKHPSQDPIVSHTPPKNYSTSFVGKVDANCQSSENFDKFNIMEYELPINNPRCINSPNRNRLRKYQWSLINKSK